MKIRTLLFSLILSNTAFAQFQNYELGLGYTYTSPIATMKQNIKQGNGLTMDFYLTPEKNTRWAVGMDFNYTLYGYDESKQEYTFSDGTTAKMNIVVDNSFLNFMVGGRYMLTGVEENKV